MTKLLFQIFLFSILLLLVTFPVTGKEEQEEEEEEYMFGKSINRKSMGLKKEKVSHFKFYWHDILSGSKPTSMMIIPPPTNTGSFGLMNMIDNPLTLGPKLSSKIVGRAQGLYASASQNDVGLMMVMNFAFIEGKYNGSTFTVLGRNPVFEKVREMAVIGGSGLFRFARGYVKATTHSWDSNTGDATVQYDAYVLHY